MSSTIVNPSLKNRCFKVLSGASLSYGILPKSYFPTGVTLTGTIPYTSWGPIRIWRGQLDGNQVSVKVLRTRAVANPDKIKQVCDSSLFCPQGELILIPIRVSTMRSQGGNTFRIRTCYPSSEFRRRCSRFALSPLGRKTGPSSSTPGKIEASIDCSWLAISMMITDKPCDTPSSTACTSCLWSAISAFFKCYPWCYKSGER